MDYTYDYVYGSLEIIYLTCKINNKSSNAIIRTSWRNNHEYPRWTMAASSHEMEDNVFVSKKNHYEVQDHLEPFSTLADDVTCH